MGQKTPISADYSSCKPLCITTSGFSLMAILIIALKCGKSHSNKLSSVTSD